MSAQRRFIRKIAYLLAIGVLLLPLSLLSQPGTLRDGDTQIGALARLRSEHRMTQANLGNIDPTSATMRFATFGLHGVAASRLWIQAIDAKNREDWTRFDAKLDQIANFQPNFVKVWSFQAWNVSYNLSVRFDDYHDRYEYVTRGMRFLERGIGHNDRETSLPWDLGMFIGSKIGRSDERRAFRRLFREDDYYHDPPRDEDWLVGTAYEGVRRVDLRDNWQLSNWWYERLAERKDAGEVEQPSRVDALFYREAPHALIEYAEALTEEGVFGPQAQRAWLRAAESWRRYGDREMRMQRGYRLRMLDYDVYRRRAVQLLAQLDRLEPSWRDRLLGELEQAAAEEQLSLIDKAWDECTADEKDAKYNFLIRLWAEPRALARELDPPNRAEALRLVDRLELATDRVTIVKNARELVSYESWRARCEIERKAETIAARQAIYEGEQAFAAAKLGEALKRYNDGIARWKQIFDANPLLIDDFLITDELYRMIDDYREVLRQNDQELPDPFPLQIILDEFEAEVEQEGEEDGAESDPT
ncbi:MAG: hypothetical protein DWQ31_20405 [Planctomycetota bacterium]|nr:MAG: hypothetical protein DWQ31_20405 [Planctomycetota bacterium]REJ92729.1 MAG: hypothetical protein DWQ35_11870 [Planctomycetota bacterium]REK23767.1 MAG: hypothetical protein DWQ42_14840 [Planctomycetota bacterium]REK47620.1 MAG: hypothetical protein DWQ46_04120 [Planctomycetota bacterium]